MDHEEPYRQYLKILSIAHYAVGAIAAVFASFPLIHLFVGLGMFVTSLVPTVEGGPAPLFPEMLIGIFFMLVAAFIIVIGWAFAGCIAVAGRFLAVRKHHLFCLVMAGVECTFMPFGTVLGILTLRLLLQPEVKGWFTKEAA